MLRFRTNASTALFLIVFLWTPPHFWALALLIKRDYAAARIPMLPVVRGDRETTKQIVLYSLVLVGFSVVPFAAGWFSAVYLAAALALGAAFIWMAVALRREQNAAPLGDAVPLSLLYLGAALRGRGRGFRRLMVDPQDPAAAAQVMVLGWWLLRSR